MGLRGKEQNVKPAWRRREQTTLELSGCVAVVTADRTAGVNIPRSAWPLLAKPWISRRVTCDTIRGTAAWLCAKVPNGAIAMKVDSNRSHPCSCLRTHLGATSETIHSHPQRRNSDTQTHRHRRWLGGGVPDQSLVGVSSHQSAPVLGQDRGSCCCSRLTMGPVNRLDARFDR
jgi:hypothetical protein